MIRYLVLAFVLGFCGLHAADGNWNVDTNGSWGVGSNWLAGVIPNAAGDRAFFTNNISASRTVTFDGTRVLGLLKIGDSDNLQAFLLNAIPTGGSLIFGVPAGSATLEISSGGAIANTINSPIILNSDLRITLTGASTGVQLLTGAIVNGTNGPKSVTLDANGTHPPTTVNVTGQANFGGFNTFNGLTIDQVRLTAPNVFCMGSGTVTVLDGGQMFTTAAGGTFNNNFVLNGLGWNETTHGQLGTLRFDISGTVNGTIKLNSNARLCGNAAGTIILNGVIGENSAGVGLDIGRWTPTGGVTALTTYVINHTTTATGPLTISSGTLRVGNGSTLGDVNSFSSVAFGKSNNNIEPASTAILAFNRSDNYTFTRPVSEPPNGAAAKVVGSVVHSGTGVVTLNNAASGYTGTTTVNGASNTAKLVFGTGGAYTFTGGTSAISLSGGADLELNTSSANTLGGAITGAANSYLINSGTGTLTINGAGDNPNARIQVNDGTVVLAKTSSAAVHSVTAANDFALLLNFGTVQLAGSGDDQIGNASSIRLTGGTLDLNGTAEQIDSLCGSAANVLNNNAVSSTLTLGANNNGLIVNNGVLLPAIFTGVIRNGTGTVALTKTGTGLQTLGGANTYTGDTTINGGTLSIAGVLPAAGLVNVNGGVLAGSGAVGAVTMSNAAGSSIRPGATGADNAVGALTLASLTVNGGELRMNIGASSDLVTVTNNANFAAPSTVTLAYSTLPAAGSKTLVSAGTLNLGVLPTLTTPGTTRSTLTLSQNGQKLDLVTSGAPGQALTWSGTTNGTWDINGTANFNSGAEKFFVYDSVAFGDGPANRTITLATGLQPSAVTVNNSTGNDYTFQTGSLAGATGIAKSGTGTLTVNTANTFSGAVNVTGGILKPGNATALGDVNGQTLVSGGGTLDVNGINLGAEIVNIAGAGANGAGALINTGAAQLNATRFMTLTGDATVGGTQRFDIRVNGGGEVLDLGGFTLTKAGANQFSVVGTRVTDGNMIANAGILSLETTSIIQGTGTITFNPGSTAQFYQNPNGNVTRNMVWNGNFVENVGQNHTINSNVSMIGDVTLQGTGGTVTWAGNIAESGGARGVTKTGTSTYILAANTAYTGATTVNGGTLQLGAGNATTLPATSRYDISGGAVANLNITGVYPFNKLINIAASGGDFRWSGATQNSLLSLANNGTMGGNNAAGSFSIASGTASIGTGSTLSVGTLRVGMTSHNTNNIGTLNILPGATISVTNYYVGESAAGLTGIVNQSGGDVTVVGVDTSNDGNFRMGHWSGQGSTYNMSGGTLNVLNCTTTIGIDGVQPTFNISGGIVTMYKLLVDGRAATAPIGGILNLSGGTLAIGSGGLGTTGNAIVNVTGGTLKAAAASTWSVGMSFETGTPVIDTNGFDVIFTGAAEGAGGFVKTGAGTLTMINTASNVSGTINANAGTLTLQGTLNGPVAVNAGAGGTVVVAAANALTNPGSALNANNGGIVVGLFPTASTVGTGAVNVKIGGILSGLGTFGNVTVAAGGNVRPGVAEGQYGTLTFNSLTSNGGNYRFNLDGLSTVIGGGSNDFIAVNNTADFTGGGTITPIFNGAPLLGNVYTLFTAGTLTGLPTIDPSALPSRYTYVIGAVGTAVTLTVTAGQAETLTWTGAISNAWNVNGTANWLNSSLLADKFQQVDKVIFNDTPAVKSPVVSGSVEPSTMTVDTKQIYTFTGTGTINGGSLTKNDAGTVSFGLNADFNNVSINGGIVQVGTGGTTGTIGGAAVTLNLGTLAYNRSDIQSFANLYTGAGDLQFDGGGTYNLLVNTSTYFGGTTIVNGTLYTLFGSSGTPPVSGPFGTGPITLGSAATGANNTALLLGNSADISNSVFVSASGTGTATIGAFHNNAGALNATTFLGTVTLNRNTTFFSPFAIDRLSFDGRITGPVGTLTVTGGGRTTVANVGNDFVGNIVITGNGSTLQASVASAGETIPNGSSVTANAGATFQLAGSANSTESIDALIGVGTVTRNVAGLQTLAVGSADGTGNFSGPVLNGGGVVALTKNGTGTQIFSGTVSATGPLTVNGGTLEFTTTNGFAGGSGVAEKPAVKAANTTDTTLDNIITTTGSTADLFIGMSIAGTGIPANSRITGLPSTTTMTINTTQTATLAGNLTLGAAPMSLNDGGILRYSAGTATDDRNVTLGTGGGGFNVSTAATVLTLSGTISGGTVLIKDGPGTLSLSAANTFTGGATINAGTLSIPGTAVNASTNIFTVNSGGTLSFPRNDVFGNHVAAGLSPIVVNAGGTVTNTGAFFNALGPVTLNGGNITAVGGANANFPSYAFKGTVSFTGTTPSTVSGTGTSNGVALGEDAVTSVTFDIADGVTGTDVLISTPLSDGRNNANSAFQPSALTKIGAGTLELSAANTYTGATTVTAGTLRVTGSTNLASTVTVNANGTLRGLVAAAGTGTVNGPVLALGTVWPGVAETRPLLTVTEKLNVSQVDFSGNGKLSTILKYNGGSPISQVLTVTGTAASVTLGGTSRLSFAADSATVPTDYLVLDASAGTGFNTAFKTIVVSGLTLGTQYDVAYKTDAADAAPILQSTLAGSTTLATPKKQVYIRLIAALPTPVTLGSFNAKTEGAGVVVSWTCISEFQNAGFNVYRRAADLADSSEWQRVNPSVIGGRITNPDAKEYALYDWAGQGVYQYKLECVNLSGEGKAAGEVTGPVVIESKLFDSNLTADSTIDAAAGSVESGFASIRASESMAMFAKFTHFPENCGSSICITFPRPEGAPAWTGGIGIVPASRRDVAARSTGSQAATPSLATAGARWFSGRVSRAGSYTAAKVLYDKPGVIRIPQSSLPAGFDVRNVSVQRGGRALTPLAVRPDALILYGAGYEDEYTNKDALFLRKTNAPTLAGGTLRAEGLFTSTQPVNVNTPATVTASYHDVYFDFDLRPYDYTPWFSDKYLSSGTSQKFTLDAVNASSGPASLSVNVWSLTQSDGITPDHVLQVLVNGIPASQAAWSGGNKMMQHRFDVPSGALRSGSNEIELVTPPIAGVETQISLLHSLSLSYTKALDGSKPMEVLNASHAQKLFEAANLPSADVWVVDLRYPDRATSVACETQAQADGTFRMRFIANTGGTGRYLIVPAGMENAPLSVEKRTIRAPKSSAYIAVGPEQFSSAVQPLLLARSKDGLRAAFVDQEQIFDYYNYGRYGPAGIQNVVRSLRPQYLLLVGRTTYDYRDYSGLHVDPLCPAFLVPTTFWSQATSDSMFGDLGRGYPEVAVGRLPVNDAGELSVAVAHVLSNKPLASGFRVHAAGDRFDASAGDFAAELDAISASRPELAWQKNYLGVTYQTAAEVTAAMKAGANGGADLIIYAGHGNALHLGKDDPRILDANLVQEWTGHGVFLQSTCTGNWIAKNENSYKSIAIQALTQPQGGISASIGTSTYMHSKYGTEFMSELLANASGGSARWGTALLKTQQWAWSRAGTSPYYADLCVTEQIFGDPAMPISAKPSKGSAPVTQPGGTQPGVTQPGTF